MSTQETIIAVQSESPGLEKKAARVYRQMPAAYRKMVQLSKGSPHKDKSKSQVVVYRLLQSGDVSIKELSGGSKAADRKNDKWIVWSKGFDGQWLADFTSAAKIRKTNERLVVLSNSGRPGEVTEEDLRRIFLSVASSERESRILNAFIDKIPGTDKASIEIVSGKLERLSVPVSNIPALKSLKRSELENFELDVDGSWVYWESGDIHLGWEQFKQLSDRKVALKAQQRSKRFNSNYGHAIKQLRMEHGLRQKDITGLSERQVSRIETGASPVNVKVLESFAKAHGMDTTAYMEAIASNLSSKGA